MLAAFRRMTDLRSAPNRCQHNRSIDFAASARGESSALPLWAVSDGRCGARCSGRCRMTDSSQPRPNQFALAASLSPYGLRNPYGSAAEKADISVIRRKFDGAFDRVADTAPFRCNCTCFDFRKVVQQSVVLGRLRGCRERHEQAQIDQSLRVIYLSGIHARIATRQRDQLNGRSGRKDNLCSVVKQ